jgi:hypothetical protein
LVRRWLAGAFADAAAMEQLVSASDLDWTIARLPLLTDRAATGRFGISRGLFTPGAVPDRPRRRGRRPARHRRGSYPGQDLHQCRRRQDTPAVTAL